MGGGKLLNFDCLPFLYSELESMQLVAFFLSVFGTIADFLAALLLSWLVGLDALPSAGLPHRRTPCRLRPLGPGGAVLPHHVLLSAGKASSLRYHCFCSDFAKK